MLAMTVFPSLLFFPSLLLLVTCDQLDRRTVTVRLGQTGQVTGLVEVFDGKELNVFRGVPYAQPPLGDLRFRRPVPLKTFGAVEALGFASACAQNASLFEVDKYLVNKRLSEDCLYLNVWAPSGGQSEAADSLRPVMVWIHGGGFLVGGASEEYYQGDVLAAKEGVVVVSMNYR